MTGGEHDLTALVAVATGAARNSGIVDLTPHQSEELARIIGAAVLRRAYYLLLDKIATSAAWSSDDCYQAEQMAALLADLANAVEDGLRRPERAA